MRKEPVVFSKKRDFGGVIGDAFQFTVRNLKSLLTGFLIYVGPFLLIGIIGEMLALRRIDFIQFAPVDILSVSAGLIVFVIFVTVGGVMLLAFTFAAIQKYQDAPEEPIIDGVWPYVRRNIGRIAIFTLAVIAAYLIVVAFVGLLAFVVHVALGVFFGLLIGVLSIYVSVPLAIAPYIYVNEDLTLVDALKKAFALVSGKWWITFAIILVLGLIAGFVSGVFVFPVYIAFIVDMISNTNFNSEPTMSGMWLGIVYAVAILSGMLVRIYQVVGVVMQYYTLKEIKEGTNLVQRIQDLDVDA